jgi:hypothetical protein
MSHVSSNVRLIKKGRDKWDSSFKDINLEIISTKFWWDLKFSINYWGFSFSNALKPIRFSTVLSYRRISYEKYPKISSRFEGIEISSRFPE